MIPDLLVHIGFHKTGTTWLQEELFRPDSSVFYPLGRNNRAMSLASLFIRDEKGQPLSPFASVQASVSSEISSLLDRATLNGRTPVVSHERLSGYPHSGGFDSKTIADRLHGCFPNARIWCVIREQKSMLASLYVHYLKNGGTDSLETYATRRYDGKRPGYSPDFIRYIDLISYYRNLFSPENVFVQPYEHFRSSPHEFIASLGEFLSIQIPVDDLAFGKQRNRHESYAIVRRIPAINAFRRSTSLNGHSPLCSPLLERSSRHPLIRRMKRMFGGGLSGDYSERFRRRVAAVIGDRYEQSNHALSEMLGIDLSKFGYHGVVPPGPALPVRDNGQGTP